MNNRYYETKRILSPKKCITNTPIRRKKIVIEIEIKAWYDEIDYWMTKEKENTINYKMGHEWSAAINALVKSHHNYKL